MISAVVVEVEMVENLVVVVSYYIQPFQFYGECPNPTRTVVSAITHEIIIMSLAGAISQILLIVVQHYFENGQIHSLILLRIYHKYTIRIVSVLRGNI